MCASGVFPALAGIFEFNTADVSHDVPYVTGILFYQLVIYFIEVVIRFAWLGRPFFEVGHDDFEIRDRIIAGSQMVVAQIFGLIGGVDDRHKLLRSEFVHGVGFFLLYPLGEGRHFFGRSICSGNKAVSPCNCVDVINAQNGRRQFDTPVEVAGLCDVVVAGIVHDTGSRAVFLRERGAAQRIDGIGITGTHVVHQTQRMAYFM